MFPAPDRLTLLQSFGRSLRSTAYVYRPTHLEQIAELFQLASRNDFTIGLRGAGRSYGDASLNGGHIILDLQRMNRILDWNPETGAITVEPGATIQDLWMRVLEDGWWPPVVPGTMFPTLGGCLGMNVHGKNNYVAGPIGEYVSAFTALLPTGESILCTPTQNGDLFHAMISGIGTLGVFTSITLQMKRIYSGDVWVHAWASPSLRQMMAEMEPLKSDSDYLVGWVDGTWGGRRSLGRGQVHRAHYLKPGEDGTPALTLRRDHQILPDTLFGLVPKSVIYQFMRPFMNNPGMWLTNTGKYIVSRTYSHRKTYLQSLIAFNFLFDYVPNWERSYGRGGLIQYQSFIPVEAAADAFCEILTVSQKRRLPTYLGVIKRHRPDKFLLSHGVDGYSLAMDFKVTDGNREALQKLTYELNDIVLQARGRFYFAKDSTLTTRAVARSLGEETLACFRQFKERCDPQHLLQTELYRRLFSKNS